MTVADSQISLLYVDDRVQNQARSLRLGVKLTMDELDRPNVLATDVRAPIVGYEVVEQREKFTVYKIQVSAYGKSWFVFRRYTDFERLNAKLQEAFPNFRIKLPGRRWFKDNFDSDFLKARARGLQFFVSNIMYHADIWQSPEVKQFFCLDDPPGPYDSLEQSRAYCQHLEEEMSVAKQTVQELTSELSITKSQLVQARIQQEALVSALRAERAMRDRTNSGSNVENSRDVKELLAASEVSWRRHAHSLTGKTARLLRLTSHNEEGESWQGNLEITVQSSGLEKRGLNRRNKFSSDADMPCTSTPAKSEEKEEESTMRSHEEQHQLNASLVGAGKGEGCACVMNESDEARKRDSGILSDNNGSPESNT